MKSALALAPLLASAEASYDVVGVQRGVGLRRRDYVWAPVANGTFPVLDFSTGGGGQSPALPYNKVMSGIAAEGYIVYAITASTRIGDYVGSTAEWAETMEWQNGGGLESFMAENGIDAKPDLTKIAFSGHSAGNHVVVQAVRDYGCMGSSAMVLHSPVDGADPFGLDTSQDAIVPGEKLNFETVTLHVAAGLDPVSTRPLFPACAPEELSNERFYNAMRGPIWQFNATDYGHNDILPSAEQGVDLLCPSYEGGDNINYLNFLIETQLAFFDGVFGGNADAYDRLETAEGQGIEVENKFTLEGRTHEDITARCVHDTLS